jgi:hypothetical protein
MLILLSELIATGRVGRGVRIAGLGSKLLVTSAVTWVEADRSRYHSPASGLPTLLQRGPPHPGHSGPGRGVRPGAYPTGRVVGAYSVAAAAHRPTLPKLRHRFNGAMNCAPSLGKNASEAARCDLHIGTVSAAARKRAYGEALGDEREVRSLAMLGARVAAVRDAALERDEQTLRGELLALSDEARRLAGQAVMLPSPVAARQSLAIERDPAGRMN